MGCAPSASVLTTERVSDIMGRKFKLWLAWKLARMVGAELVPQGFREATEDVAADIFYFTEGSGFLRDMRYPGGRQAERKLRDMAITLRREIAESRLQFPAA